MDWEKRQARYRKINQLLLAGYIFVSAVVLLDGIRTGYGRAILYSVLSFAMLALPYAAEKLLRVVFPADSRFLFYLFSFGAVEFGSAMNAYDWIPWWDLLLHGFSGALAAFCGYLFYNALRHNHGQLPDEEWRVAVIFMNLLATTSAALWEYYEFLLDTFLGFNAQNGALGVSDTMTDMMICTAGALVFSLWLCRSRRKQRQNIILLAAEHFYWRNGLRKGERTDDQGD